MAFDGERMGVTNVAQPLLGGSEPDTRGGWSCILRNRSAVAMDLGGAGVASGEGFEILPDENLPITAETAAEVPYVIAPTAGPHRLDVLRQGVSE